MEKTDLLHSYEKDFIDCLNLLNKIVEDSDPLVMLQKNKFLSVDNQRIRGTCVVGHLKIVSFYKYAKVRFVFYYADNHTQR